MYSNMIQIQRTFFSKAYDASAISTSRMLRCNIGIFDNSTIAVTPNPNGVVFRFNRNIFNRNIFYLIDGIRIRESESGGITISAIANICSTVYSEVSTLIINHTTTVNSNRILSIAIKSYTVGFFDNDKTKIVNILRSGYCHISGYIDHHRTCRIDRDFLIVVSVQLIRSGRRNGRTTCDSTANVLLRKCRHCPRRQECQHHTECQ